MVTGFVVTYPEATSAAAQKFPPRARQSAQHRAFPLIVFCIALRKTINWTHLPKPRSFINNCPLRKPDSQPKFPEWVVNP